jgi:hypothetical protein
MIADRRPVDGGKGVTAPDWRQALTVWLPLCACLPVQREPVGVVDEPVEDGVGDGRVGDHLAPLIDRQLDDADALPIHLLGGVWQQDRLRLRCHSPCAATASIARLRDDVVDAGSANYRPISKLPG